MNSRARPTAILILAALLLSLIPAAGLAQPASASASAATACDWAQFIADVTIPDGSNFAPGATFRKTWRLKNIGTCTWTTGYALVFDSGDRFGAPASINFPISVAPGQTVDLSVDMTAPATSGHYFSYWKLKNAAGGIFGIGTTMNKAFWAEINVVAAGGVGYDFTANAPSAAWSSGAGALTFPGTDGSANGFALKRDHPKFESGVELSQAGMLFVPNNVTNGFIQATYPAFRVNTGDKFQATIGCEHNATSCYVAYRLDYQIGSGAVRTFWTFREKYEGLTYNVNLNLNSLAGQDVKFILVINAYGAAAGDRALWGNPIISRVGAAGPTPTKSPTVTGTPPTPTPTGSATVQPASGDRAQFIADVTIPDGTIIAPGATFSKTWRIKNIGTNTWTTAYSLIFDTGAQMGGPSSAPMPTTVAPGQTVDLTISLVAPTTAGTYRGYWKFKNAGGVPFGIGTGGTKAWWVEIRVTTTVTPSTPGTPATPATPIAGTSLDFVASMCSAAWFSSAGQLPCPGTDGDARGFVLRVNNPVLEGGTTDPRPGLLTYPQNITNGYIQGIFPPYRVQTGDRFRSIVNCQNGATSCFVVFRLDYQIGSGAIQTFWAFVEKHEGLFYQADLSLAPLVGQDVKFILTVLATGSPVGDRAMWVAPMIFNASAGPTATPTATATITPTGTQTSTPTPTSTPAVISKFDFGTTTSALAAGYTRVTETTAYASGFGWTDLTTLESRDRSGPADDIKKDFVMSSSAARTFKVDLANGNYTVTVTMGDNDFAHDNMVIKANTTTVAPDVDSAAGAFTVSTFPVTVSGGSLLLEFSDAGGTDASWIVNGIVITSP